MYHSLAGLVLPPLYQLPSYVLHGGVQATDAAEKSRSLRALAYAPTPALVSRTLSFALDADVKSQDVAGLIAATARRSNANLQAAWSFLEL